MEKGEIKINRIKAQNKVHMDILSDVLSPEVLHERVPRLAEVQEARVAQKNMIETARELGKYKSSFFHHVANIDQSVWSAVLQVFARHDPETGELIDDGLLYKFDPDRQCLVLNRDFFYALLSGPLKRWDYRTKTKIMTGYSEE